MVLFVLFVFLQMKPKGPMTSMEALNEYILIGTVCVITEESSI